MKLLTSAGLALVGLLAAGGTASAVSQPASPTLAQAGGGFPGISRERSRQYSGVCLSKPGQATDTDAGAWCRYDAFVSAPDDRLIDVIRAKASIVRAMMALSTQHCAEFAAGEISNWQPDSPALTRAGANFFRAENEALLAGYTAPQRRGPVTPSDWRQVIEIMLTHHVDRSEAQAVEAHGAWGIAPQRRCAVQLAYFESIAEAPKPVAGRVIAFVAGDAKRPPSARPRPRADG